MIGLALTRWPDLMPANFSAVYALIFCAAVYFPKRLAWCLILPVLLLTDILLNLHYGAPIFHIYMVPNYLSYACILWLGQQFSSGSSFIKLLGGGLLGPREISPKTQINIAKQASESPTSFLESTSQICVYPCLSVVPCSFFIRCEGKSRKHGYVFGSVLFYQ